MKILILTNNDSGLYQFRKELLTKLIEEKNDVYCSFPFSDRTKQITELGCECIDTKISRHGTNPFEDFKLFFNYIKLLKKIKPDVVLTYTIKPNVYGGLACSLKKIPYIANITGLGGAVESGGLMQKLTLFLYKIGLKKAGKVFFQNSTNKDFMLKNKIIKSDYDVLPGSGVNLLQHSFEKYPNNGEKIILLIIGRIMKDKGTDEILEAAEIIKHLHPNVIFRFIGPNDGYSKEKFDSAVADGYIEYLSSKPNIHDYIKESHATLHASYHEGMSNVLLETAACGRPIIATDVPGCRETYDEGVSGISFKPRDVKGMVDAIEKFLSLSNGEKAQMGAAGRKKMEKEFNRDIIVDKYLSTIKKFIKEDEENELVQQNS